MTPTNRPAGAQPMKSKTELSVLQNPDAVVPTEVLAASIVAISEGIKRLRAGKLTERALLLLIQHAAPPLKYSKRISTAEIRAVLEGMESLSRLYVKKAQP